MEIGKIVNRAYKFVRNSRVLWRLGLLAILTEGFFNGLRWPFGADTVPTAPPVVPVAQSQAVPMKISEEQFWADATRWAEANQTLAVLLAVAILTLMVFVWYLSFRAKAGLIITASESEESKMAQSYNHLFKLGRQFAWKLFGLYLIIGVIGAGLVSLISLLDTSTQSTDINIAGVGKVLVFLLSVVVTFYLSFLLRISEREVVTGEARVVLAIKRSHQLLRAQFKNSLVSLAAAFGLYIVFALAVAAVAVVSIGIGALLAVFFSTFLPAAAVKGVIILLGLLLLGLILFMIGWYSAFMATYWTYIFLKLKSLQGRANSQIEL